MTLYDYKTAMLLSCILRLSLTASRTSNTVTPCASNTSPASTKSLRCAHHVGHVRHTHHIHYSPRSPRPLCPPHPSHPHCPPCPRGHILCERRHFVEFVLFWKCPRLVQLIRSGRINHINTPESVLPSFTGKDKIPIRLIEQNDRHWGEQDGITEDVTKT